MTANTTANNRRSKLREAFNLAQDLYNSRPTADRAPLVAPTTASQSNYNQPPRKINPNIKSRDVKAVANMHKVGDSNPQ